MSKTEKLNELKILKGVNKKLIEQIDDEFSWLNKRIDDLIIKQLIYIKDNEFIECKIKELENE